MAIRTRNGHRQLDRRGVAARTNASSATVDHWFLHRAETGFPHKADTDATGRDWWWQTDIDAFRITHLANRAAAFTEVDRSGDPDDLLTAPQAARVLGYKDHRSMPDALLSQADQVEELSSGRRRRRWHRRTIWAYADERPSRRSTGRPAGSRNEQSRPHPYADDPRLDTAIRMVADARAARTGTTGLGTKIARHLGIAERTGQRLIEAAIRVLC